MMQQIDFDIAAYEDLMEDFHERIDNYGFYEELYEFYREKFEELQALIEESLP